MAPTSFEEMRLFMLGQSSLVKTEMMAYQSGPTFIGKQLFSLCFDVGVHHRNIAPCSTGRRKIAQVQAREGRIVGQNASSLDHSLRSVLGSPLSCVGAIAKGPIGWGGDDGVGGKLDI